MRARPLMVLSILAAVAAGTASAETVHFTAKLDAASETPPNSSAATGAADVTLDTDSHVLTWSVSYSGLTGPATAAHFHGPAAAGVAAGVTVPLSPPLASPIAGKAVITDAQVKELRGGLWYVNVHTAANPKGEIRGQVEETR